VSKNKPKETIEHVFRLQDKERQLLDDFLLSKNFNNVATPIVSLLSDVSGLAASYVILSAFFPNWAQGLDLDAMEGLAPNKIYDYLEIQNIALGVVGAGVGIATGGLGFIPALIGFGLGQVGAEIGEEAFEKVSGITTSPGFRSFMFHLYLAAKSKGLI